MSYRGRRQRSSPRLRQAIANGSSLVVTASVESHDQSVLRTADIKGAYPRADMLLPDIYVRSNHKVVMIMVRLGPHLLSFMSRTCFTGGAWMISTHVDDIGWFGKPKRCHPFEASSSSSSTNLANLVGRTRQDIRGTAKAGHPRPSYWGSLIAVLWRYVRRGP